MSSFDDKVEALRRLREKRQARQDRSAEADAEDGKAAAKSLDKELDGQELTAVLEHYASAGGHESIPTLPVHASDDSQEGAGEAAHSAEQNKGGDEGDALYCLGHCFEQGLHECSMDKAQAAGYYRMAAEKGSTVAQWRLGHLHEYGEGVEQSHVQAAHWYGLAAETGHPHAQSSLALLFEEGRAGDHDDSEALHWHLAAAAQGNALSQYCAACCLAEGRGAERDEASSRALLEKSSAAGFPPAVEALADGRLWKNPKPCKDFRDENVREDSLLDIAARVAKQIGHLSDAEADTFLEELMGSLDDDSELGAENLQEVLASREMPLNIHNVAPAWSNGYPCAAAA